MAQDTDYNPAVRREVKADAETGRTFKKWKHRAQGAVAGAAGVGAILAGRKIAKKFSTVPHGTISMAEILGVTTDLSLHGGFKEMLESTVRLKKSHVRAWKNMDPKERHKNREEMRHHRSALNDQESAANDSPFPHFSNYSSTLKTTDLDVMCEKHPAPPIMDPETLRKKKLNAGQTKPQAPLMPQEPIVRIKSQNGKVSFNARRTFINFAADSNGRPHSSAGTFEPEIEGISPQSIQRAYSPHRLTGKSPLKSTIQRQISKRALARVGATIEL